MKKSDKEFCHKKLLPKSKGRKQNQNHQVFLHSSRIYMRHLPTVQLFSCLIHICRTYNYKNIIRICLSNWFMKLYCLNLLEAAEEFGIDGLVFLLEKSVLCKKLAPSVNGPSIRIVKVTGGINWPNSWSLAHEPDNLFSLLSFHIDFR